MVELFIVMAILSLSNVFVKSEIEVTPGRVTLFDIAATYTGVDPEVLKSIVLAYFPEGEYTLKGTYIKELASRKGIEVTLESSVVELKVTSSGGSDVSTLSASRILVEASDAVLWIASDLSIPASCVEATLVKFFGKPLESGEKKITYTRLPNGFVNVSIGYYEGGFLRGYLTLRFEMSCERKVYVARRIIRLGDTIHPDMISEKTVDVFRIRGKPASYDEILYAIARRFIREGEVITEDAIKRKPDVVKGQVIMAYVVLPGVRITAMVEALENGYIGDTIRARNISTGKVVTGTIEEGPVLRVLEVVK